jgi:hypothetical protein
LHALVKLNAVGLDGCARERGEELLGTISRPFKKGAPEPNAMEEWVDTPIKVGAWFL